MTAPYLLGRQDGDVVLIDKARLLLDGIGVGLSLQLLTREPEHYILLRVFAAQKIAEYFPSG